MPAVGVYLQSHFQREGKQMAGVCFYHSFVVMGSCTGSSFAAPPSLPLRRLVSLHVEREVITARE
jgi:hypothetical protein